MINAEKFRKELLELSNQNIAFAVRRENQNAVVRCDSIKRCTDCLFGRGRCSASRKIGEKRLKTWNLWMIRSWKQSLTS